MTTNVTSRSFPDHRSPDPRFPATRVKPRIRSSASYTIQIDNNQTVASPFVLEQTLTVSTFSTSTLPIQTMWFRVRANDAAGNPGNWSSTRRFEVKD